MKDFDMYNPLHFKRCVHDRDIVLFGAAETASLALSNDEIRKRVKMIVDNNERKWGRKFDSFTVVSPKELLHFSGVVLITTQYVYEIVQQLEWMGIKYYFHYETIDYIAKCSRDVTDIDFENVQGKPLRGYNIWEHFKCYAHALGVVDGIKYTNSQEAFYNSYKKGYRIFECDLKEYVDGILLCHGGEYFKGVYACSGDEERLVMKNVFNELDFQGYPLTIDGFLKEKVFGKYASATIENLVEWMKEFPDTYFLLDIKSNYSLLRKVLDNLEKKLSKRIIAQIGMTQLDCIEDLRRRGIEIIHLIEDFYCKHENRYTHNELIRACIHANISVLTLGKNRINASLTEISKRCGISICAYDRVNSHKTICGLHDMGVKIFCTEDFFVDEKTFCLNSK